MTVKALLISLEFAPVQTTGAFRPIAAAKYLPEFGVTPVVLTIDADCASNIWHALKNDALFEGLPADLEVLRMKPAREVRRMGPRRRVLQRLTTLSDGYYKLFRASLADSLKNSPDLSDVEAVIVTVPPFGAAKLGVEASRMLSVPLILDARDAWTQSDSGMPAPSYLHYTAQRRSEFETFSRCSAFMTVTERLRLLFARDHVGFPEDRQFVVANGFEGNWLDSSELVLQPSEGRFDVAYVGNFYGGGSRRPFRDRLIRPHLWFAYSVPGDDWSYRGPQHFFAAWRALYRSDPKLASSIRFHHIGSTPTSLMPLAAEYGLDGFCKAWGVVPRQKVNDILQSMHAMLATSMKRPDGGDFCLASKTFDYVLAHKPVLAFVCDGSQRDFLERAGIAVVCDPDDVAGSAETLRKVVTEGVSLRLNADYVNQFHRREAARRMADVIYRVAGRTRTDSDVRATAPLLPYI